MRYIKNYDEYIKESFMDSLKKMVGITPKEDDNNNNNQEDDNTKRRDFVIKTVGEDVKKLQTAMTSLGFDLPVYHCDGIYGPETQGRVKSLLAYIKKHHADISNGVSLDMVDDKLTVAQQDLIISLSTNEDLKKDIQTHFEETMKDIKDIKIPYYEDLKKYNADPIEFVRKTVEIANKLQTKPEYLLFVMWKESKYNPAAVNKDNPKKGYKGTGATGLIQFMPGTAEGLGTTTDQLYRMTGVEQLEYVYKFYKNATGKLNSLEDLYLYAFFPIALGKPDDWIVQAKNQSSGLIASQNPAIDINKSGEITVGEFKKYVRQGLPSNILADNNDKTMTA